MNNKDSEFRRWLERILRMIALIKAALARNEWALETVTNEILEWKESYDHERLEIVGKNKGKNPASEGAADAADSWSASIGVHNIIIEHNDDGSMFVQFDKVGLPVRIERRQRLRQLVIALCGRTSNTNGQDNGEDPFVPFKTSRELIDAMQELSGARISLANLQGLVQQLRTRLLDARVDPRVVETGQSSYRIRLRRDGSIHDRGR